MSELTGPIVGPTIANSCPTCGSQSEGSCPSCAKSKEASSPAYPSFVYALGKVEPRYPRISVEKEVAQVAKQISTEGLTDAQVLKKVLSDPLGRFLARLICWVFRIEDQETFILHPRDPLDFSLLVASLRDAPRPTDLDAVIGVRGRHAPTDMCNGLSVPVVTFDQLYHFDRDSLVKAIPRSEKTPAKPFDQAAEALLDRILRMTGNTGDTDEYRALNYLAVRYPAIYTTTAEALERDSTLSNVQVRPSRLSNNRKILDVIFSYRNRKTDVVEKFYTRVDATEEFLFLITPMSQYYDIQA
jgi:hypothetical protein